MPVILTVAAAAQVSHVDGEPQWYNLLLGGLVSALAYIWLQSVAGG